MKGNRLAVITVVSSVLLICLFCFAGMKNSSTAAVTVSKSSTEARSGKSHLSPYARFEAPKSIAPQSL
jgi:hypothetical protein